MCSTARNSTTWSCSDCAGRVSPAIRPRWRRARRWLAYGALLGLISLALLVALASQLLPLIERHPRELAHWLSAQVGQPLRFSAVEAHWTRRGPRLALHGLEVGEGEDRLAVGRADLQIAIYSGLLPGRPFTELGISGLRLGLHQDAAGHWRIEGLPQAGEADPFEVLEGFGELRVQNAELVLQADRWGIEHVLPRADLRLLVDAGKVRGGARLWSAPGAAPLEWVIDFDRQERRGQAWVGGDAVELAAWSPMFKALGIEIDAGQGRLGAWVDFEGRQVTAITLEADLAGLDLRQIDRAQPPCVFESARFALHAEFSPAGWQLQLPLGVFRHEGREQRIEGLWMAGGAQRRIEADRLDAAPLFALASLVRGMSPGWSAWLAEARPRGTVSVLRMEDAGAGWRGGAELAGLGFDPVGGRPGFDGLGGRLHFDADAAVLAIAAPELRLAWPRELGGALPLALEGDLVFWREAIAAAADVAAGRTWSMGSSSLRIAAPGIATTSRFTLRQQGDGSLPQLDLALAMEDFDLSASHRLWPRHTMAQPTREWLQMALRSGRVESGRIVLGGDLDHWPFGDGRGRFEARAAIDDAVIRFNPDWPQATGLSGELVFDGSGMDFIDLQGRVLGAELHRGSGGIADFREPWLDLDLRGGDQAAELRRLLRASPLYARHREHLDSIRIEGRAALDLQLRIPLVRRLGDNEIEGSLRLWDAVLGDRRHDIEFHGLNGEIPFSHRGFLLEALPVRYGQTPARLSLRVGDQVRNAAMQVELGLVAELDADQLLARAPGLDWLSPWIEGSSDWDLRIEVPRRIAGTPPSPPWLRAQSNLVGTRIGLPAPLRKSAATSLPLRFDLPLGVAAAPLELALGRLLRLRGRLATPDRPFAGVAEFGTGGVGLALPESGLAVRGEIPSLDIAGWVAAATAGTAGEGGLSSVDVRVGGIDVLDRSFGEGRVELRRSAQGIWVGFQGPALQGEIDLPQAEGARIDGRFSRLHWPAMDAEAITGRPGEQAPAVDTADPTRVPPLRFTIEDFRLGEARLGRAELHTFPTPEGMRIDRFSTMNEALRLDASGHWSRIGDRTRSRLAIDFASPSLGRMLDALGFVGMVEQGPVEAQMSGDWPGSPGSFRLDRFDGELRLEVGRGRLLDVEPGTGRFLGLVSIAEVPRRLMLDFSDFFAEGFAFNTLTGDFAFQDGAATTANLRIDGPAAEIHVTGTTLLVERRYQQRVEVLPRAGGMLPVLGAVAGGPAGIALGTVAHALFGGSLKQTTRTLYSVEGPWAEPVVEVIERGPRRLSPVRPPASLPSEAPAAGS